MASINCDILNKDYSFNGHLYRDYGVIKLYVRDPIISEVYCSIDGINYKLLENDCEIYFNKILKNGCKTYLIQYLEEFIKEHFNDIFSEIKKRSQMNQAFDREIGVFFKFKSDGVNKSGFCSLTNV